MTKKRKLKNASGAKSGLRKQKPLSPAHESTFLEARTLFQRGQLNAAKEKFLQILAVRPKHPESNYLLAICFFGLEERELCERYFRRAADLAPTQVNYVMDLGIFLFKTDKFSDAEKTFEKASRLAPNDSRPLIFLGRSCKKQDMFSKAVEHFEKALQLSPDNIDALISKADALLDLGEVTSAEEYIKRALAREPNNTMCHSNLLFNSNYIAEYSPQELFQRHIQGAKTYPPADETLKVSWDGKRKIRLGFISGDFKKHSVAFFLWPLMCHLDKERFEVYCYYTADLVDPITKNFRRRSDQWFDVAGLDDRQLTDIIRAHNLDVIIDLAGHSSFNRLTVLSRRVAPIQINWLGYPHSTGIQAMDYRIVDNITDPAPDADSLSNESLVRLNGGFLCYKGDSEVPYRQTSPFLDNGYITFGSFNNFLKINDKVIEAWAHILMSVPRSRIVIKTYQLSETSNRSKLHDQFQAFGIDLDRVELMSKIPSSVGHLSAYNQIDIALDTFPYNGATTTCEALWMGVPTIAFTGDRHASRVSASIMRHSGLEQFVAKDLDGYKKLAIEVANNPEALSELRPVMRDKLNQSDLCNTEMFTSNFENALLQLIDLNIKDNR